MIYCVNYLDKGFNQDGKKLIYAELYTENTPSSLDIVPSADIDRLPEIRPYDEMEFSNGSILLVVSTAEAYTYLDGTFVKIGT